MHNQPATYEGRWDDGREQRLLLSFVLAAAIVAAVLSIVRLPSFPVFAPIIDLVVRIVETEAGRAEEEQQIQESAAESAAEEPAPPAEERLEPGPVVRSTEDVVPSAPGDAAVDWDAMRDSAVQEYMDRTEEAPWAFDPRVDELRREGRFRYQPPTIEQPGPIWENVEPDQLGRTVLRDGDCYKVIDDPNVGSQYQFQTFGQYIPVCTWQPRAPRELPWVETIRNRYDYLRSDDTD